MAKGLTPIIGLAVVVALAMVAVFGAMSLTNPAFAAIGQPADAELAERAVSPQVAPMNLMQDFSMAEETVTLKWDAQDTYVVADYQVRWKEADVGWISGQWAVHGANGVAITAPAGETAANMALINPSAAVQGNPMLQNGSLYDFQVRIRKANTDYPSSEIEARPNAIPTTDAIIIGSVAVDDEKPGEVTITWSPSTDPETSLDAWQYQATTIMVTAPTGAATNYLYVSGSDDPGPGPTSPVW